MLLPMVAGPVPFAGNTMSDVSAAVLQTDPPALTVGVPDVLRTEPHCNRALRKESGTALSVD